jgi:hypothetical protein
VSLLQSPWPIDRIWRANQPGADPDATVSLDQGGACFEVYRLDDDVVFRMVAVDTYAFRSALAADLDLQSAVDAARRADPRFELTDALRELLDDGLVVGAVSPSQMNAGPRCKSTPRPC